MNNGILRQSTPVTLLIGPFIDTIDGVSTVDNLTIQPSDVQLSKAGGALAGKNDASNAVQQGQGVYLATLDATDTNTPGYLAVVINMGGALYVRHSYQVVEEVVYDSLYALDSAGWPALGLGARQVVITVDDGTNPVENAHVRVSNGLEAYVATTDASGQVEFNLNDATWMVTIAKPDYIFAAQNLVVAGNVNQTYSLTATSSPTPPADPNQGLLYVYTKDILGKDESGLVLSARLSAHPAKAGQAISTSTARTKTNSSGYAELALVRNDVITVPADTHYVVTCKELGIEELEVTIDQATVNLADLIT